MCIQQRTVTRELKFPDKQQEGGGSQNTAEWSTLMPIYRNYENKIDTSNEIALQHPFLLKLLLQITSSRKEKEKKNH